MRLWPLVALLAACGSRPLDGSDGGAIDLSSAADLAPEPPDLSLPRRPPSDHPPQPKLTNHGGSIVPHMKMWTIVWKGEEALGARVNRFHSWMLGSDYWIIGPARSANTASARAAPTG